MGLLRNASGLLIPDSTGRLGRADDPEFHIRRLEHFGKGMGIDLASTHPTFSGKNLASFDDLPSAVNLSFLSHDEGLGMSKAHSQAAEVAIDNDRSGYGGNIRDAAIDELRHRSAYEHNVENVGIDLTGSVYKDTSEPMPTGVDYIRPAKWLSGHWGSGHKNETHAAAVKDVSSRFQEFNRNRKGPDAAVSELVNKGINNPSERLMRGLGRVAPSTLGSQFLGVGHFMNNNGITGFGDHNDYTRDVHDHIDLKTGTWAKIDPEGYFPD